MRRKVTKRLKDDIVGLVSLYSPVAYFEVYMAFKDEYAPATIGDAVGELKKEGRIEDDSAWLWFMMHGERKVGPLHIDPSPEDIAKFIEEIRGGYA